MACCGCEKAPGRTGGLHHIDHMQEHCDPMIPYYGPIRMAHGDQASHIQSTANQNQSAKKKSAKNTIKMATIVK